MITTAQRVARVLNGQSQWTCDGTRCVPWEDPRRCGHNRKVVDDGSSWFCCLRKGHKGDHIGCGRDHAGHPERKHIDTFHAMRTWPRDRRRKSTTP